MSGVRGRGNGLSTELSGVDTASARRKSGGGGIGPVHLSPCASDGVRPASPHAGGGSSGIDRSKGRRAAGDDVADARPGVRIFPLGGARNGAASILDVLFAELALLMDLVRSTPQLPPCPSSWASLSLAAASSSCSDGDIKIRGMSDVCVCAPTGTGSTLICATTCAARTTPIAATVPGQGY